MFKVVKYHNDMNTVPFRRFLDKELDLFFSIILEMRDKELNTVIFDFKKIKEYMNVENQTNERFFEYVDGVYNKMLDLYYKIENEEMKARFNIFSNFKIFYKLEKIEVSLNPDFRYILNDWLGGNYTKWDYLEFKNLKSTYSKTLFRLLHQFKTKGKYRVLLEEFRRVMDVPESYEMKQVTQQILTPCIEELKNHFQGLKVNKIRDGRTIKTLEFTFRKFKNETVLTNQNKLISVPVQEEVQTKEEVASFNPLEEMNKAREREGLKPIPNLLKTVSVDPKPLQFYLKNGKYYWNEDQKKWGGFVEKSVFVNELIADKTRKLNNLECNIKSF